MKEKTKNNGLIKKAIRIGVIAIIAITALSIILGLLGNNFRPRPISLRQSFAVPQSAGLSGKSVGVTSDNAVVSPSARSGAGVMQQNSQPMATDSGNNSVEKKVVKNGDIDMRVKSADDAAGKITQIAKDNGGDVFSSNFYQSGSNSRNGYVTVKVPANNFDQAFNDIKKVGVIVTRESTSGTDVTAQYVDLQSQLTNAQAEEQAYLKLLNQAQKMEDILSITTQLSDVRGQIETLQGQMRYMDSQTDMAAISVNLSEDTNITVMDSWRPWQIVKESANALIKSVQAWINFLIRLIIQVIPVLILYGIIIFVFYKLGRLIYLKFKKKSVRK